MGYVHMYDPGFEAHAFSLSLGSIIACIRRGWFYSFKIYNKLLRFSDYGRLFLEQVCKSSET